MISLKKKYYTDSGVTRSYMENMGGQIYYSIPNTVNDLPRFTQFTYSCSPNRDRPLTTPLPQRDRGYHDDPMVTHNNIVTWESLCLGGEASLYTITDNA